MEKSIPFPVSCLFSFEICFEWGEPVTNLFFYSKESDYPAFLGERQGYVKAGLKSVNIMSRLLGSGKELALEHILKYTGGLPLKNNGDC
jgi:hypothetical protein